MKNEYYIKKLWFTGPGIEDSPVEFINGLNIIHGANDTGKSWILDSFDFMCGLDHEKFVIDKSTGCDTVHLEVETGHGTVTMTRQLESTKIDVESTDPRIDPHQYTAGKSKYWINSVWMKILGIDDNVKVIMNENAKRQSLTLRSFLNLLCVSLENMNRRQSIFYTSGGPFSKTAMKSTLLYFLNEEEFEEYKEVTGKKQKNAEKKIRALVKNENLEYLSELKLAVKKEALSPEQVKERIAQLMQQINEAQGRITEATAQRSRLSDEIVDINEDLKSASLMKHRYQILRGQYHSDIKRITFIIDGEQKLSKEKGREEEFQLYSMVERLAPQIIAEERKIYKGVSANVDFYSGFVYSMLDLPTQLFTPIFAIARVVGWSAHRLEELANSGKIIRPAYKGISEIKDYVPIEKR